MRKRWLWAVLIVLLAVVVVAPLGFVAWATLVPEAMPAAAQALESNGDVQVTRDRWLVFMPAGGSPQAGLIFYPGGRVRPEAYAPFAQDIAAAGYLVVIVPMPLNLAVLGAEAASEVIAAYPDIAHWAIGGHSLGGAMAARFAHNHPDVIDGLVLWAAYPEASMDMSARDLAVVSIYGTLDGLASTADVEAGRALLPPTAEFVAIEGGNHAQFGWYGDQAGDAPATISREEQQRQTVMATLALLARIAG
jgi:pimeloyl-ACP methyl ester carboxylesterase